MEKCHIYPAGDCTIIAEFGDCISEKVNRQVLNLEENLKNSDQEEIQTGIVEMIPTYRSLMIVYRPEVLKYEKMEAVICQNIREVAAAQKQSRRIVEIPVCYSLQFGLDLLEAEKLTGLSREEIISIHSGRDYRIYMLGFLPGFPYLGGLDERIAMKRLECPRTKIPAGSVGIGGIQTGIYPVSSPGGWRLIGRTPVKLYDPDREEAIPYRAGDYIRFHPVDMDEYEEIRLACDRGEYVFRIRTGD